MMDILGLPAKHFEVIPPRNAVLFPSIYISYPFFQEDFPLFLRSSAFSADKNGIPETCSAFSWRGKWDGKPRAPSRAAPGRRDARLCPDRSNDNRTNRTDRTNRKARSENLFLFVPFVPFVLSHSIRPPGSHDRVFFEVRQGESFFANALFFNLIFYDIMIL